MSKRIPRKKKTKKKKNLHFLYQYVHLPYRAELIKFQSSPTAAMYDLALFRISTPHHSKWKKNQPKLFQIHISKYTVCSFSNCFLFSALNFFCQSCSTFFFSTSHHKQKIYTKTKIEQRLFLLQEYPCASI